MAVGTVVIDGEIFTGPTEPIFALFGVVIKLINTGTTETVIVDGYSPEGKMSKRFIVVGPSSKVVARFEYEDDELGDSTVKRIHSERQNISELLIKYSG